MGRAVHRAGGLTALQRVGKVDNLGLRAREHRIEFGMECRVRRIIGAARSTALLKPNGLAEAKLLQNLPELSFESRAAIRRDCDREVHTDAKVGARP
jgi:hypothetical protein